MARRVCGCCIGHHRADAGQDIAAPLVDRICAASRTENRAAGERLAAIGELDVLRLRESGECESWATDTWEAVSAEVAAALRISRGRKESPSVPSGRRRFVW